jgi:hypothetical protein
LPIEMLSLRTENAALQAAISNNINYGFSG